METQSEDERMQRVRKEWRYAFDSQSSSRDEQFYAICLESLRPRKKKRKNYAILPARLTRRYVMDKERRLIYLDEFILLTPATFDVGFFHPLLY